MPEKPVILVTGASSGFGETAARLFALRGYRVGLAARRIDRLEALAESIRANGGEALPVRTDIANFNDVQNLARTVLNEFGRIDVLFNNAGFGRLNWLEKLDPITDIQKQIEVDLLGLIWMAQAVLPHMIEHRRGHIINMASMASLVATPTYTIYAASKYGVRGFTEALRREVGVYGVHISAIYPGGAKTGFNEVAGINRTTNIHTPSFLVLSSDEVAQAVWRLVQKPKRAVVMPWQLKLAGWGNILFPGVYDWAIERLFVRPERSSGQGK
jgi:short-subunit dehydrogenase